MASLLQAFSPPIRCWGRLLALGGGLVFTPWRVLLYGAGDAGLLSLRELRQNPERGLKPIGFIDDDPKSKAFKCKVCPL